MGHGPRASVKQGIVGSIPASRTKKNENLRRKLQAFSGFGGSAMFHFEVSTVILQKR